LKDLENLTIEPALKKDAEALTEIAFAAKRHWRYPEHYFDIWKNELTITKDYIHQNIVIKTVYENAIIGFFSIIEVKSDFYAQGVFVKKGYWLEHIFIKPAFHKSGIGKLMITHAKKEAINRGITNLLIFVDPFAKGFYEKIGAEYLYDSKSSIKERFIPVYKLKVK
jgi:maltose O-acetyltransferase